ncbi:NAD-P-binding protein [Cubamyces sp. BRFM 1775]|nr:NAD-P-binding protein [Cubamyces sp. BRFM 1775]
MTSESPIVLITGCSDGGIGSALCKEFAAKGCKVYATARRVEAMSTLESHPNVERMRLDVTDQASVQSAVDSIVEKDGRIDVLVNNAGMTCSGPVIDIDLESIQRTFDTNVFGIVRTCKAAIPHMAARKSGTIVNIGSVLGDIPMPFAGIYASTKAAVRSLTESLYMECRPLGIAVVHVNAGGARTNIVKNMGAHHAVPPTTLYGPYAAVIQEEFDPGRTEKATRPEEFARVVVKGALPARSGGTPERVVWVGAGSSFVKAIRWLPKGFVLRLLWNQLVEKRRQ